MKIMISYQVDTTEEAKKVLDSVDAQFKQTEIKALEKKIQNFVDETKAVTNAADIINTAWEQANVATNQRPNVDPGAPSITKIGSKTKEEILYTIKQGFEPLARFEEHYKLLWSRGEIKYDGEKYYL